MVTEDLTMSLTSKREYRTKIHGRYHRAGRLHKTRILDEFCLNCGYHRKAALRLLNRPLRHGASKRSGPKIIYDPSELLPVLKSVWLASDQLCSKLLKPALPEWLVHQERRSAPLPEAFKQKLLAISPAQLDRLLKPVRVGYMTSWNHASVLSGIFRFPCGGHYRQKIFLLVPTMPTDLAQ